MKAGTLVATLVGHWAAMTAALKVVVKVDHLVGTSVEMKVASMAGQTVLPSAGNLAAMMAVHLAAPSAVK